MLVAAHILATISILVVIVTTSSLVRKVLRPFVFMGAAILLSVSASLFRGSVERAGAYILEPPNDLVDIRRGVLVQLLVMTKDDHGDIDGTEDG